MTYKNIYWYFCILIFVVGQPLLIIDFNTGASIFLGMLAPAIMSYINIQFIERLSKEKGNLMAFGFNMMQFIIKSIFLCSLTYLGVKIIKLDFRIFVPLLCLTWFVFHLIEAFFTNSLIKKSIINSVKTEL